MESKKQLIAKLRILEKPYISFSELRKIMGISSERLNTIKAVVNKQEKFKCPYHKYWIDGDAVLDLYGIDKKQLVRNIKNKLKEFEKNDN